MVRLNIIFWLFALIVNVYAASPPSFCKCTCFTNSTIIALSTQSPSHASSTCATCNKDFCLKQHLPICKDATDKDVFTTCFQRDSRKDQIVVITFIAGTLGLLAWAAVRKVLEKRQGDGVGVRIGEGQDGYAAVPVGSRR